MDDGGRDDSWVPDEADFAPSPPKPRGPLTRLPTRQGLMVPLAFYSVCAAVSFLGWEYPSRFDFTASGVAVFERSEWWRLVTSLFAHKDIAHLTANGPMLVLFGWLLRHYFGLKAFPFVAVLCGVASNLVTIKMYEPAQRLLGCSGMNFALVALWLVLYIRFDTGRKMPRRLVHALGFAMAMLLPTEYEANVSYLAHASGFAAGVLAGLVFWPFFSVAGAAQLTLVPPTNGAEDYSALPDYMSHGTSRRKLPSRFAWRRRPQPPEHWDDDSSGPLIH